jgi:hypothetical protein
LPAFTGPRFSRSGWVQGAQTCNSADMDSPFQGRHLAQPPVPCLALPRNGPARAGEKGMPCVRRGNTPPPRASRQLPPQLSAARRWPIRREAGHCGESRGKAGPDSMTREPGDLPLPMRRKAIATYEDPGGVHRGQVTR